MPRESCVLTSQRRAELLLSTQTYEPVCQLVRCSTNAVRKEVQRHGLQWQETRGCLNRLLDKRICLRPAKEAIKNILYRSFREGIKRTGYLAGAVLASVADELWKRVPPIEAQTNTLIG